MLQTGAAALPLATILVLMLGARWPAARAGAVGLAVAVVCAACSPPPLAGPYAALGALHATAGALGEALFTSFTILWILFPALCLHHLQSRTGAIEVLRAGVVQLTPDPRLMAVLVAWFFGLFLEGAAGFGTPVALAAPLLVGAGFAPVRAVSMALLGHAAGVSFGAVGTPVLAQVATTGYSAAELARTTAVYHGAFGWVLLLALAHLAAQAAAERGVTGRIHGWLALAAALFLGPYLVLAFVAGPELPTLGGAAAGGLVFAFLLRWCRPSRGEGAEQLPPERAALFRAAAPYMVLVLVMLATRLPPPIQEALQNVKWQWTHLEHFRGSVHPLYHPGTALLASVVLGVPWQRVPFQQVREAAGAAARQLVPVALALVAMLGLSRVMVHAGMIETLARAAAILGTSWPLFAPAAGALGTFVTGSATASNILLTNLQAETAEHLRLPVLPLLAAQAFGAAAGNVVCPHNLIAGGASVGLAGAEGDMLRRTLLPCAVYVLLGGGLALILCRIGGS